MLNRKHMECSFSWIKRVLGIKGSVQKAESKFPGVVVGKILEIEKHPNADRLQIATVDIGPSTNAQGKQLSVVCGASNIEVGQKVPVALVGAILLNGIEIKEAEIRGVKSFGMLCAKDELGLGTDHSGIMILDEKAEVGMKFSEYNK